MQNAGITKGPQVGRWLLEAALFLSAAWCLAQVLGLRGSQAEAVVLGTAVVLVAAHHGLAAGVATGLGGAALAWGSAGGTLGDLLALERDRAALINAYTQVALGGLVGLAAEGHRRALQRAGAELVRLRQHVAFQDDRLAELTADKEQLERRFAHDVLPVAAIAREAEALTVAAPAEVAPGALALAARYLGASAAAYYALDDQGLRLEAGLGLDGTPGDRPVTDSMIGRAVQVRELQSARTLEERARSGAWLAAPVLAADGVCQGVLVIHEIPFARLTPVTQASLSTLASRLGLALAANPGAATQADAPAEVALPLWPNSSVVQVRIEVARRDGFGHSQSYGFPEAS